MTEAILVFRRKAAFSFARLLGISPVVLHLALNWCAVLLSLLGFAAIYVSKVNGGRNHFTSWHSILGGLLS